MAQALWSFVTYGEHIFAAASDGDVDEDEVWLQQFSTTRLPEKETGLLKTMERACSYARTQLPC